MSQSVEEIQKLAVTLELEAKSFDKQMSSINKVISNTEKAFKLAGKGVDNYENTFVGLNAKIQKSEQQVALYQKRLELQRNELKETEDTLQKQKTKLESLANTVGENSKEYVEWSNKVQDTQNRLKKLSVGVLDSEKNIERLKTEIVDSKKKFEELGTRIKSTEEQLSDIDRQARLSQSEMEKLGSELERSGSFFQKLGHQMTETATKMESGRQKIDVLESEVKRLSQVLQDHQLKQKEVAQQIEQTTQSLTEAEKTYGSHSTEAQELKQKLLSLKDQYQQLETEIDQNKKAMDEYQTELNQTQTEVQQLSDELRKIPFEEVSQSMKSSGEKLKSAGQSLTLGVTTPILGVGAAATTAGVKFDTAMSKLQATAGIADKTSESFIALENKAKELGAATSFSASDAADGLTYLALAGWDVETSIERIEPVLRAAEAGNMELATASDLVTDSMSAAGIASEEFTKYLDIVAQSQRKSNTSMQQMLEAYIGAGGIFKQLNMPLEESGALLGVLANRGKKGSEAANGLISVFSNLITETGQAGNALIEMGISLYDSEGKQRNMIEVLKEMAKKLGMTADGTSNLTEQQKQQYAAMVGGKTQFDTLMAALSGVSGEYDELYNQLVNSNGALNEVATTMKDNLGGEIESMSSALEGALIEAFKALEPVLSTCIGYITDAARWFTSLDEEQQKNIVTLGLTAAAIGPLLAGVGQLIIVGGNAVTLFGKFQMGASATTGATGGLTKALGVFASPVGAGVAIAALVALMAYMGDNENMILSLQEKFGGLGTIIGGTCEFVSGVVQLTIGQTISWFQLAFDVIAALIDGPGGATVEEAWKSHHQRINDNLIEGMQKITLTTTRGMSQMRQATDEELNKMITSLDTTLEQVPTMASENYRAAAHHISTQLQGMSANQLTTLRGMNDTTGHLFRGIREEMTIESATNMIEQNLKEMAAAGKLDSETFSKEIQSAMETMSQQLDQKTSEGSQAAKTNTSNMTTELTQSFQTLNKDVSAEVSDLQTNVETDSEEMAISAIQSTERMSSEVMRATNRMANQAISDWERIRQTYSRSINGSVNLTTSTSTARSTPTPSTSYQRMSERMVQPMMARTQPLIDVSSYRMTGGEYRLETSTAQNSTVSPINQEMKEIKSLLAQLMKVLTTDEEVSPVIEPHIYLGNKELKSYMTEVVLKECNKRQRSRLINPVG